MARKYVLANEAYMAVQNGSTEFKVIDSTGDVIAGAIFYGNSTLNQLADSSGQLKYMGYDENNIQIIASGDGSTATAILGYGITIYDGGTGCSLLMSAPPYVGCKKTIIFSQGSSIARSINSTATTGSTDNDRHFSFWSTAASNSSAITMSTLSTQALSLELFARTTKQWQVLTAPTSTPLYALATT
jgi:hypothetical protein